MPERIENPIEHKEGSFDTAIDRCVDRFESAGRIGLLVVTENSLIPQVANRLIKNEMYEVRTWWSALERLKQETTTFMILDRHISLETIDIIEQITHASDNVVVVDRYTREVEAAQARGRLLLVTSQELFQTLSKVFPVLREGLVLAL